MEKTVSDGVTVAKKDKSFGKGNWKAFFRLIPKIKLPWVLIILAFAINMAYQTIMTELPFSISKLFSGDFSQEALWSAIWFYVAQAVSISALSIVQGVTLNVGKRNAREKLWNGMLVTQMGYYGANNPSSLMSAITNDLTSAVQTVINQIIDFIPSLYYVVVVLIRLNEFNFLLMLSVLILLPVNYVFMVIYGRWQFETNANVFRKIGGLTGYLVERIRNLTLIKSFTNEPQELENGTEASKKLYGANMQSIKVNCVGTGVNTIIKLLQSVVIVVFGILLVRAGKITLTQWVAFFLYAQTLTGQVNTWVLKWTDLKSAQGAAARVIDIMNAPKENFSEGIAMPNELSDIEFKNVSFAYGQNPVIKNLSFTIKKGKTTAIVGVCGSGKTTVMNLIERLYAPQQGEIALGGIPIGNYNIEEYRRRFSYVQQNAEIFSGTIREALLYGSEGNISDQELTEASKLSGAYEFISKFPQGLDTPLAVGGSSLSGGQRQRLVLAREFLKQTDYLLFDEPTSALDSATTKAVQQTMFDLFKGKTMIIITHDLNLITQADQIILLDSGIVEANGTHKQLLESCRLYKELVEEQRAKEDIQ